MNKAIYDMLKERIATLEQELAATQAECYGLRERGRDPRKIISMKLDRLGSIEEWRDEAERYAEAFEVERDARQRLEAEKKLRPHEGKLVSDFSPELIDAWNLLQSNKPPVPTDIKYPFNPDPWSLQTTDYPIRVNLPESSENKYTVTRPVPSTGPNVKVSTAAELSTSAKSARKLIADYRRRAYKAEEK